MSTGKYRSLGLSLACGMTGEGVWLPVAGSTVRLGHPAGEWPGVGVGVGSGGSGRYKQGVGKQGRVVPVVPATGSVTLVLVIQSLHLLKNIIFKLII